LRPVGSNPVTHLGLFAGGRVYEMTMAGELILFPVRLYVCAARFAVRTGLRATGQAAVLATQAIRSVTREGRDEAPERPVPDGPAAAAPVEAEIVTPPPAPVQPDVAPPPPPPAPADEPMPALGAEPIHVSEEPTVVEEFAEPGAEDGAGAEVTIDEPWAGYARMSAGDVIARLVDATPAELAAVQLYESAHRQRETVTAAAAQALRATRGRGPITADQSTKEQPYGQSEDLE
jgi:type IV secretory pathway VirB10-like protein